MKIKRRKKSRVRNIITLVSDIIFIFVLLLLVKLCINVRSGEVPGAFGFKALRVVSSSMEPLLSKGDCILIKKISPCDVKEGDVISFFSSDPMLEQHINTHRVVSIQVNSDGDYSFTTKGDNNKYEDYYQATGDNLLGVYYSHLPFKDEINWLFDLLSNRIYYFVIMILPILFCLIESVISLINAISNIIDERRNFKEE